MGGRRRGRPSDHAGAVRLKPWQMNVGRSSAYPRTFDARGCLRAHTGELCTSSVPGTIVLHLAQQGQPPEQADA